MIDEARTLELFGYTTKDIAPQSHKKVVAICELCGNVRVVPLQRYVMQKYPELCQSCMYNNPERGKNISIANTGRHHTDEARANMSASQTGRKATPETLEKMRIGHTGIMHTQETKDKISVAHTGKKLSAKHCAKMSTAFKGRKLSPEWRENISKANMGHEVSTETRAKLHDARLGTKHTEESKAKMSIAHSGENNAFYGRKHTDETKTKMSILQSGENNNFYGKKLSPEAREKISGKNNWNWKGGITPIMEHIRQSLPYKNWRTSVFERDNYTCQMCNVRGGSLQSHHIEPVRDNKNTLLIFDVNNGITLCKDCHNKTKRKEYDFIEQFKNIVDETNTRLRK